MTARDTLIGRALAVVALLAGAGWLVWRSLVGTAGAPLWSTVGLLVVEAGAVVATVALVWALWEPGRRAEAQVGGTYDADVDVVVRVSHADIERVRATLLAAQHLGPLVVLDLVGRDDVAALARDTGATVVVADTDDLDGVVAVAQRSTATSLFVLEAGDIPHPDALRRLLPLLDLDVAAVQAPVTSLGDDTAEHRPGGRHDHDLERRALVPALGARGVAPITGRGALLRRTAVVACVAAADAAVAEATAASSSDDAAATHPGRGVTRVSPVMARAELTLTLFSHGWRVVAPAGEPLVVASSIDDPSAVEDERAAEASAARRVLVGPGGALRLRSDLSAAQRLGLLATSVRPLSGVRRSLLVAVLLGSLLSGTVPLAPGGSTMVALLGLWLPWFVLSSLALWLLSGGALVPGDRLRTSMRSIGASWRGVMDPNGVSSAPGHVLAGVFGLQHGFASAATVAAISIVIGLRALSDRVSHTLATMSLDHTVALLGVALWMLAGGLDALRLLARRAQARRATRIVSSLPSTFAERAALVVDLTPHGAGVVVDTELTVGAREALDLVVPTTSGCVSATLPVVVRNVRPDLAGEQRVGVEFEQVDSHVADALAEYCMVQPALDLLGAEAVRPTGVGGRRVVVADDRPAAPRRLGLRAAALVAVVGAVTSVAPSNAAEASGAARVDGAVVVDRVLERATDESAPATGTIVTAVCAIDPGADGRFGTSDDLFTAPVSTPVAADGAYRLEIEGEACWRSVAPAAGFMVRAESSTLESPLTPQVVDLGEAEAGTLSLVPVVGGEPEAATTTDSSGTATVEDVVWADADADGILDDDEVRLPGVTVTLLDLTGTVVGSMATDDQGVFRFDGVTAGQYRLAVSNLPTGWMAADVFGRTELFPVAPGTDVDLSQPLRTAAQQLLSTGVGTASSTQLLAPPAIDELRGSGERSPIGLALAVVALAALLGASVVLGSVRPQRSPAGAVRFA